MTSIVLGRDLPAWTVPTAYTVNLTSTTNFVENGVTAPTYANVCVGGMVGAAGTITGTAVTASTVYVNPPATPQTTGFFGTVTSAGGSTTQGKCGTAGNTTTPFTVTTFPVTIPLCLQASPPQIPACAAIGGSPAYETTWVSPTGLNATPVNGTAGVQFATLEPGSSDGYALSAVPNAAPSSGGQNPGAAQTPGGGFAVSRLRHVREDPLLCRLHQLEHPEGRDRIVRTQLHWFAAHGGTDREHSRHADLLHECHGHR